MVEQNRSCGPQRGTLYRHQEPHQHLNLNLKSFSSPCHSLICDYKVTEVF